MRVIKLIIFSLILSFSWSIVYAKNEIIIKNITPVYDKESSIVTTKENNNYSVTFNEENQNIKYKVELENTTENNIKAKDIVITIPSKDILIYEIEGISKDDVIKSKETKELVVSISSLKKDETSDDFSEELLVKMTFEEEVKNPNTNTKEQITILIILLCITITCIILSYKNKRISRYVAIFIICLTTIPIAKAKSIIELQIKINVNYKLPIIKLVSGDGTNVGDEINIRGEHFYVVSNDGTNATLLAKYNLEKGKYCNITTNATSIDCFDIENPSGLQNEKALGIDIEYIDSTNFNVPSDYGVIPFSSKNYWEDNKHKLLSNYGTSYPAYIYDDNSNIKTHVDNYAEYLKTKGLKINETRLIKQEELVELGCNSINYTCTSSNHKWVYSTSYWTASTDYYGYIWIVFKYGAFGMNYFTNNEEFGIRPVIVIPSSEIKNEY